MRNVVLQMQVTADGFVCGPNDELEWVFESFDDELKAWTVEHVRKAGVHIMGAKTYRDMASYWPNPEAIAPGEEMFAAPMNEIPKVVFSRTLTEAGWRDTRIARGDLREEIEALRREPGNEILAHGGASFAQSLAKLNLIDEYRLLTHPIAFGTGRALFSALETPLDLKLVSARAFPSGTVAHVYRR